MFIPCYFTCLWLFVIPYIFVHNLALFLSYCFNKFHTLVWGHTKIPGGECHRHWKWDMKDTEWFMHGRVKETGQGCWQMCRCVSTTVWHMNKGLSNPKYRSRWKWCHLMMSLMSFLCIIGGRDKRKLRQDWGAQTPVLVLSLVQLFGLVPQLVHLGSHRPSNSATLVILKELNYNQTGKCSLFVNLYIFKVILGTLSWCDLVVCKLVG